MAPQFKVILNRMYEEHEELFTTFQAVHDAYVINPEANREKFNTIGRDVQDIIRGYERILCGKVSSGVYSKYAANLSQKFWDAIRKKYPKIDFIGVE